MRSVLEGIKSNVARRGAYLSGAKAENRSANMNVVCVSSVLTIVLLLFFLAIAPLALRGWTPSAYHVSLVPAMAVFTAAAFAYRARSVHRRAASAFCVAFMCIVFGFCMLIDVFSDPAAPSSFMPSLLVALPALFILPLSVIYAVALSFSAAYCVLAWLVKTPEMAPYGIFQALVAIAFSVCIVHLIMNYRVRAYEVRLRFQELSTRDALADILNRRALVEEAQRIIAANNPATSCALVAIDVDDFKHINDEHGHPAGDEVLMNMSGLLKEYFRTTDLIGRFGGDEFIVLVNGPIDEDVLSAKLARLQKRFADASLEKVREPVSCSVGAVIAIAEEVEFATLVAQADAALYESKQNGKNRMTVRRHEPAASDPAIVSDALARGAAPNDGEAAPGQPGALGPHGT